MHIELIHQARGRIQIAPLSTLLEGPTEQTMDQTLAKCVQLAIEDTKAIKVKYQANVRSLPNLTMTLHQADFEEANRALGAVDGITEQPVYTESRALAEVGLACHGILHDYDSHSSCRDSISFSDSPVK